MALEGAETVLDGLIRSGKLAGRTMWSAIWFLAIPILLLIRCFVPMTSQRHHEMRIV